MIKFSSSHLHLKRKEPSQNHFIWQNVISTSHQQLKYVKIVEIALKKNLQNVVLKRFTLSTYSVQISHIPSAERPCGAGGYNTGQPRSIVAFRDFLEVDIGILSLCNILAVDL